MPEWALVATADDVLALAGSAPPVAVVEVPGDDDALAVTAQVLEVVRAWLTVPALEESRLVVATRGAVPAGGLDTVTDPAAAAVWGLVRSAQAEHPDRVVLLDVDATSEFGVEPVLGSALASGEAQVATRGTALLAPRLVRGAGQDAAEQAVFGPGGTVLVSGAGSLGGLVARHLVAAHGVRRLVLASRSGPDAAGVAELSAELAEQGAEVAVVACDLADREQVAALLAEHPVTGVVHTAGVFDDGVVGALTRERLAGVFAPKVDAVRHLDELTRDAGLTAFVVFSSVAGVIGGGGQGSYAAANAYLDAAMAQRRAAGLPGLSLAWGLWDRAIGMGAHLSAVDHARAGRGGVQELARAEGLALFDLGLRADEALLVPIKLDLAALRADAAAGGPVPHLLRGLVRPGRRQARAAVVPDNSLVRGLAGLAPAEQEALLLDLVRAQIASVLGHSDVDAVGEATAFKDAGFDSLTSVELRNRLREQTGLKLPATLVFDYPTPAVLARHLREGLARRVASAGDGGLIDRLAGLAPAEQESLLLDLVRDQIAAVLGHSDVDAVREDTPFKEAGFDSLTSVELRNRLREQTGLKLPATLVFDYPTPAVLARHLREGLGQRIAVATGDDGLAARLIGLLPDEQEELLVDVVRGQVAVVLGHPGPADVRADVPFKEAGFDSLTSVELRNRLREQTGLKLPATLVFDYPTPVALARHLRAELAPDGGADVDEARLRRALASIPLARFREAGLMGALVRLATVGEPGAADPGAADPERSIAELDVDDLVDLALGGE
ncbi:type I polyketide synthase [Actinokineospora sp. G85]|uniref:type I polyketide synthase n=1 Tax=Actinokineospora sp. G85 TaxID=3406626 RepID=UPI003C7115C4